MTGRSQTTRRRSATGIAIAAVLAGAAAAGGLSEEGPGLSHAALDRILADVVRGEGVDYPRLRERHLDDLDGYLDRASRVDPESLDRSARLALLINVYNATVLREVARRDRPGYSVSENDFELFERPLARIGGRAVSLNGLEHERIRAAFRDPRIHAALVCAARSCPPLLPRAYLARDLDETLDANMRRFVLDPSRNTIDLDGRRLVLSRIFDWYAEDFGGRERLAAYVDRFAPAEVSGFDVSFRDYSWELNRAAASGGVSGAPAALRPGSR